MATTVVCRVGLVLQKFPSRLPPKVLSQAVSHQGSCIGATCFPCQRPRSFLTFTQKLSEKPAEPEKSPASVLPVQDAEVTRENFIPITRRSLVRCLMQEKSWLTEEELGKFEAFSLALDSAIVNRYHSTLQELKSLFDPINPDKDTVVTRQVNRRERLDNEFWLIQKMGGIMEKANFRELPRSEVERALAEHQAREGVMVSVDTDKYDVMRFWVLGRETSTSAPSILQHVISLVTRTPPPGPLEYYKRIVVAVRLKRDDKLLLKGFKEVPVNALEQLVPDGNIKMTKFDQGLVATASTIAGLGILAKIVTHLAHIQIEWTLIVTAVTGLVGFRAWSVYKNRRNSYLLDLNRMLYFKNIANNRGLLALLVDRAEDELFKECLLTYTFLLTSRAPSTTEKDSSDQLPVELGSLPISLLENKIQDWVFRQTNARIRFKAGEAVQILSEFGILSEDYNANLHVLPLEGASRNLPITSQTLAARAEEHDIVEGYDHDPVDETLDEYKNEDKKRKLFGWF